MFAFVSDAIDPGIGISRPNYNVSVDKRNTVCTFKNHSKFIRLGAVVLPHVRAGSRDNSNTQLLRVINGNDIARAPESTSIRGDEKRV